MVWDSALPIDKDLGNLRYLTIGGADYSVPGPISSSGSTVSISTPLDLMSCQLSAPMRPGESCWVPSNRIAYHACTLGSGSDAIRAVEPRGKPVLAMERAR